ncbi:MAG: hypothetical protein LR015_07540 [Verrucomicrobia bacterium]|nr:hypothetical protein [Verrucomicrobiota bacterium]
MVEREPSNAVYHYNYACSLALLGEPEGAVNALQKAIELGYEDFGWMIKDPDLKSLHSLSAFQNLLV